MRDRRSREDREYCDLRRVQIYKSICGLITTLYPQSRVVVYLLLQKNGHLQKVPIDCQYSCGEGR